MASQNSQRVRKIVSPSTKQGPLKATKSFGLKTQTSPSASPTQWGKRRSPDYTERGSPNSPIFKEKSKPVRYSPVSSSIKRTGSYDTIAGPYLKGEWPKGDQLHTLVQLPQTGSSDKSTQTEEWDDKKSHKRSSSVGNGEMKNFKARLAKSKEGSKGSIPVIQRSSPLQGNHYAVTGSNLQPKAVPVNIPYIPKAGTTGKTRGSVEGLNQEIEKLVLRSRDSGLDDRTQEPAPDGHRAPVLELLAPETRSVDTQTPSGVVDDHSDDHSSPSSLDSPTLPIIPVPGPHGSPLVLSGTGLELTVKDEIKDEAREGTDKDREDESPNLNSCLFVREPPDGCEKVKIVEDTNRRLSTEMQQLPESFPTIKKPGLEMCRIPSTGSAFCPLFKPYVSQPEMAYKRSSSISPRETHTGSPASALENR